MGIAAGKTTKTNKMGYVVALPISFFLANINAFQIGAQSVNPRAETRVVFTGTFLDPGKRPRRPTPPRQGVDVVGVIVDSPSPSFKPLGSSIKISVVNALLYVAKNPIVFKLLF